MRTLILAISLLSAGTLHAQRQISLELTPVHGAIGLGARHGSSITGGELGFGFPQLDYTLQPGDDDLIDFVHLGAFRRTEVSPRVSFDVRFQVGLAELRGCSGCLPGFLTAMSVGGFVGGRHVKIGTRLTGGVIFEHDTRTAVLNFRPLAMLLAW